MIYIIIIAAVIFLLYKLANGGRFKADENSFEQAGVKVVFADGTVTIKGRTYKASEITGIERKRTSNFTSTVYLKVDDFQKPVQQIIVAGSGEKFVQRLSTALRKAGGASFY